MENNLKKFLEKYYIGFGEHGIDMEREARLILCALVEISTTLKEILDKLPEKEVEMGIDDSDFSGSCGTNDR